MAKIRHIAQGSPLPEWFLDIFQEEMTGYASANFAVTKLNATTLQVKASAADQVGIALTSGTTLGFRYNTADVTGAVPGGLTIADHDVYVIASANAIAANPSPPPAELDSTVKTFGLKLLAVGTTPSGTGSEAYYRKVATFYWDGAQITEVRPLVGAGVIKHAATHNPGARDELDWLAIQNAAMPAGCITQYAGAAVPSGWLLCDGTSYLRTDYLELFNALGGAASPYGLPDGTHFQVPDMRGTVPVGRDAAQSEFNTLGLKGGVKAAALSSTQMPVHNHGGQTGGGTTAGGSTGTGSTGTGTTGTSATGGADRSLSRSSDAADRGLATSTVQPYISVNGTDSGYRWGTAGSIAYQRSDVNGVDHLHYVNGVDHLHSIPGLSVPSLSVPSLTVPGLTVPPLSISNAGGSTPVSLLQPYIVLNHIVKT